MYDYDLFVIGGGVNGTGVARDAAGRGLRVGLAEMNDLASATSSASTKLFHGGLRYLEYWEIKLVRHALAERETLLTAMPHISWPMRFVLPHHKDMRFDAETPVSKLLSRIMPWLRGRRPSWMIRIGLLAYDHLGGRRILPGTRRLDLRNGPEGAPLKKKFRSAYEYSDCWVEDARLVVLNARDAEARGADILTRTKVVSAERGEGWALTLEDSRGARQVSARAVVNAGGPWVEDIVKGKLRQNSSEGIRLVRGSHIVTRKLYDHEKCYFFQGTDGRIIFAIPYQDDFTLIGTTDKEHERLEDRPRATEEEQDYLRDFASQYFETPVTREDIVWTYSGVRPLYDDGAKSATAATRDYVLSLDDSAAPLLSIFGGKITTYRVLAEDVMDKLLPIFPQAANKWTAHSTLPGGDFALAEKPDLIARLRREHGFLTEVWARRLIRAYGTEAWAVLGGARRAEELGPDLGATLTGAEVRWLIEKEYARTAEDVVWRRSKLGLRLSEAQVAAIDSFMDEVQRQAA